MLLGRPVACVKVALSNVNIGLLVLNGFIAGRTACLAGKQFGLADSMAVLVGESEKRPFWPLVLPANWPFGTCVGPAAQFVGITHSKTNLCLGSYS